MKTKFLIPHTSTRKIFRIYYIMGAVYAIVFLKNKVKTK
jgi:hypothetical protein